MPSHRYRLLRLLPCWQNGSTARTRIPVSRGQSRQAATLPPRSRPPRRRARVHDVVSRRRGVTSPDAVVDAGSAAVSTCGGTCLGRTVPPLSNLSQLCRKLPRIRVSFGRTFREAALDDLLYRQRDSGTDHLDRRGRREEWRRASRRRCSRRMVGGRSVISYKRTPNANWSHASPRAGPLPARATLIHGPENHSVAREGGVCR